MRERLQFQQTVILATVPRELETSKRPPTGGWPMRVSDCSTSDRIDSISGESVPGVDDASLGHVKISRRLAISRRDQAANS